MRAISLSISQNRIKQHCMRDHLVGLPLPLMQAPPSTRIHVGGVSAPPKIPVHIPGCSSACAFATRKHECRSSVQRDRSDNGDKEFSFQDSVETEIKQAVPPSFWRGIRFFFYELLGDLF